jgi:hypothetical protein
MAINIRFGTTYDNKGLRLLNKELGNLSSSVGSLGTNFAIAGAAIVGAGALLGKAVQSASNFEAEFEGVNQVFKEAAGSVQAFAEQASRSAGLSATEALQAAKTFGLFATGAGLGTSEAATFSKTMVQLAGDLGSFNDVPTQEALQAIQSGLMGQSEPLRKFGVFLDDARLRQEALNLGIYNGTGPLDTQQKMMASYSAILAQTTIQQGDFVKYSDTLGNQLKTVQADFQNLTKDIGMMLIPVITEAMPYIAELARQLGEKLKSAIQSIDWVSLINAVVATTTFFVDNAEAIGQVIIALFALNTLYKLVSVGAAIASATTAVITFVMGQLAAGIGLATIALNVFKIALVTTGIGALIVGVGYLVSMMMGAASSTEKADNALKGLTRTQEQYNKIAGVRAAYQPAVTVPSFSMPYTGGGGKSRAQLAAEEAQRKEQELLDKRQRSFESFNESVKSLFGQIKDSILSSFSLPSLGNSVSSITRNIAKLLETTKNFATNITKLSGLGLNSALLQQVIQAGPMAGSQLANALVSGGAGFIAELNASYGEFGNLAGGIAGVATSSAYANTGTINNYSIEVTGGVATSSDVGRAVVNAIKDFERQSGTAWRA